jgi:hypothetical protein
MNLEAINGRPSHGQLVEFGVRINLRNSAELCEMITVNRDQVIKLLDGNGLLDVVFEAPTKFRPSRLLDGHKDLLEIPMRLMPFHFDILQKSDRDGLISGAQILDAPQMFWQSRSENPRTAPTVFLSTADYLVGAIEVLGSGTLDSLTPNDSDLIEGFFEGDMDIAKVAYLADAFSVFMSPRVSNTLQEQIMSVTANKQFVVDWTDPVRSSGSAIIFSQGDTTSLNSVVHTRRGRLKNGEAVIRSRII